MKGCIRNIGCYLPETKITNEDLAERYSVDADLILKKTGIQQRHYASLDENSSSLAVKACRKLLKKSNLNNFDFIQALILSTATPEFSLPGSAHRVQAEINKEGIPVYELRGGSGDFLKALEIGSMLIETKKFNDLLVIGTDTPSKQIEKESFDTGILFGDGSAALHLTSHSEKGSLKILDFVFGADGKGLESLYYLDKLYMDGKVVMLEAIARISQTIKQILEKNHLNKDDIAYFIFHQANLRLLEFISKTLELNMNQTFNNIEHVGNTSNASIPLCLGEFIKTNILNSGDKIVLAGFSSGFSYGACLTEVC